MKTIFEKAIRDNSILTNNLLAVKSADSMTGNQMVARVKTFYNEKND